MCARDNISSELVHRLTVRPFCLRERGRRNFRQILLLSLISLAFPSKIFPKKTIQWKNNRTLSLSPWPVRALSLSLVSENHVNFGVARCLHSHIEICVRIGKEKQIKRKKTTIPNRKSAKRKNAYEYE